MDAQQFDIPFQNRWKVLFNSEGTLISVLPKVLNVMGNMWFFRKLSLFSMNIVITHSLTKNFYDNRTSASLLFDVVILVNLITYWFICLSTNPLSVPSSHWNMQNSKLSFGQILTELLNQPHKQSKIPVLCIV